jgi:hypothetical protein
MIHVDKTVRGKEYARAHHGGETSSTSGAGNQKGEKVVTGRATVTLPSRG